MANPQSSNQVEISFKISKTGAVDFAELVKRLARRDLGPNDLNLGNQCEPPTSRRGIFYWTLPPWIWMG